jgi:hypothetical protein
MQWAAGGPRGRVRADTRPAKGLSAGPARRAAPSHEHAREPETPGPRSEIGRAVRAAAGAPRPRWARPPPPGRAGRRRTGTRRRAPVAPRHASGGGATKRKARQPLNWPTTSRGRRSMSMGPSTTPSNILNRNNIVMRHHRETQHRARSRRDHTREGLVRRCGRRRRCPRRWQCPWRSALVAVGSTLRAAVSRAAP